MKTSIPDSTFDFTALARRTFARAAAPLLALPLLSAPSIGETTINFDDAPSGAAIDARYAGIAFTNPLGGSIYARAHSAAPSPGNVVSVFAAGAPEFDARWGAIEIHFATPMRSIAIDARPEAPLEFLLPLSKRPYIQAYDATGTYLGATYYAGALPTGVGEIGPAETLTYTSTSANIVYARISSQNPAGGTPTYGLFDNLRFDPGAKPFISAQPQGGTSAAGNSLTLTANVTGDPPLTIQWQFDGAILANETNSTLARAELTPAHQGDYRFIATNPYGAVTSSVAHVVVPPSLAEAVDTSNLTWTTGGGIGWYRTTSASHDGIDSATCESPGPLPATMPWMQTTVIGPGTVSFDWIFPATVLTTDALAFTVDGVEQARIRMRTLPRWSSSVHYLGSGHHTLRWAYVKGGSFSGGPARVDQVVYAEGGTAPFVVTPPSSQTVTAGTNVTISVEVDGTPPFTYQWQRNEIDLPGANESSFSLTQVNPARAGNYRVVAHNAFGAVTSAVAVLTILPGPNTPPILEPIVDVRFHAGVSFTLAPNAVDADTPTNTLTFSLLDQPSGMTIDPAAGTISWPTSDATAGVTHDVVVKVADNGTPSLSATQRFNVMVAPRPRVTLNRLAWIYVGEDLLGNRLWRLYPELSWTAISNTQYRVFYTTNVAADSWTGVMTTNLPFRPAYVTATGAVATAFGPAVGLRVMNLFPRETTETVQPRHFFRIYVRP